MPVACSGEPAKRIVKKSASQLSSHGSIHCLRDDSICRGDLRRAVAREGEIRVELLFLFLACTQNRSEWSPMDRLPSPVT